MQVQERSFFQRGLCIVIDWKLYEELLYGSLGRQGKHELSVETFDGLPPDGNLGFYNPPQNHIGVDIGEIGLVSMFTQQSSRQLDDKLTNVLAHEGKHYVQQERFGYIKSLDRYLLTLGTLILTVGLICGFWYCLNAAMTNLVQLIFGLSAIASVITSVLTIAIWISIARYVFRIAYVVFFLLKHLAYRISWEERDARRYAKAAEKDPRWSDVVRVDPDQAQDGFSKLV